jgi:hypothetical protein
MAHAALIIMQPEQDRTSLLNPYLGWVNAEAPPIAEDMGIDVLDANKETGIQSEIGNYIDESRYHV